MSLIFWREKAGKGISTFSNPMAAAALYIFYIVVFAMNIFLSILREVCHLFLNHWDFPKKKYTGSYLFIK